MNTSELHLIHRALQELGARENNAKASEMSKKYFALYIDSIKKPIEEAEVVEKAEEKAVEPKKTVKRVVKKK